MNQQRQKAGLWKPWKNEPHVFPPFPQPLLLLENIGTKTPDQENTLIIYTKRLTLPGHFAQ